MQLVLTWQELFVVNHRCRCDAASSLGRAPSAFSCSSAWGRGSPIPCQLPGSSFLLGSFFRTHCHTRFSGCAPPASVGLGSVQPVPARVCGAARTPSCIPWDLIIPSLVPWAGGCAGRGLCQPASSLLMPFECGHFHVLLILLPTTCLVEGS